MSCVETAAPAQKPRVLRNLPPFPAVAARLLQLVHRETVSFQEVSKLIRCDAAFSSQVLRLANSALLGCRREISSILHALAILGSDRLESLVLTVALNNYIGGARHAHELRRCWRHNLASALMAQELAASCFIEKDIAYTAGLMHEIGLLALLVACPAEYSRMLARAEENHLDILKSERDVFEIDHCQAGRWLMREWNFPKELQDVAAHHHYPQGDNPFDLTALVQVACRAASAIGFGAMATEPAYDRDAIEDLLPVSARNSFAARSADLPETIASQVNLMECSLMYDLKAVRIVS